MMYAYSEKFVLVLSHDEVVHGKCSMFNKMPGYRTDKFANLRAAYGFMMGHPGKKLLFMGQEFAQEREWSEARSLDWELLDDDDHQKMQKFYADLNKLYTTRSAFTELDNDPNGFKWMSCLDADHSIVSFIRYDGKKENTLLFVFNFTPVVYSYFIQAVPYAGNWKEILNSDAEKYGGSGRVNSRVRKSRPMPKDGQNNSIEMVLPPLSVCIFEYKPVPIKPEAAEKKDGAPAKKKKVKVTPIKPMTR